MNLDGLNGDIMRELKDVLKKTSTGRKFLEEAEPERQTDNLIEFANEQSVVFPEDSAMGGYLRETLKILQAEPCEDAISKASVFEIVGNLMSIPYNLDRRITEKDVSESMDEIRALPPVKPVEKTEMEKHTDRQIYDGCIILMQKMVDYFQEYLDYLGYDLDKLDEDERFAVGMSNMEIVRQLFLQNTRNSGGCSTRDFCEKLGVDAYNSVKFEFERDEEE